MQTGQARNPSNIDTHSKVEVQADLDRRLYLRACAIGACSAAILFIGLLALSGANFFGSTYTTDFYSEQMRSLVHLHWDMPNDVLGIEGFEHAGKWFMYYGPFPALLRLPFLIAAPGIADQLTQWSMLLAFWVALRSTSRLLWQVRGLVGPAKPSERRERLFAGCMVFTVGAGSCLLFLGGQAWIYHEAEIWGAALAIGAFDAILRAASDPARSRLLVASAWTTAAILTRVSVGLGPVAALGLIGLAGLSPFGRRFFGLAINTTRRTAAGFLAAGIAPVVLYSYTNFAKFGNLFVFPTAAQSMSQINPQRIDFLANSGGSYFGLKFIPSTLWQYLRPDALRLHALAPFIDFPSRGRVFGNVVFDAFEPSSSLPASMPAIFALATGGFFSILFSTRRGALSTLRPLVLAATVGSFSVLPFGYVANRYLSDFMPLLVILGCVGLFALQTARFASRARRYVAATLIALAIFSVTTNVSLAVSYHYTSNWTAEHLTANFLENSVRIHNNVSGGQPSGFKQVDSLPYPPAERRSVYVVGDCDGIYSSAGEIPSLAWSPWHAIQRGEQAGRYDFEVTFAKKTPKPFTVEPLVIRGEPGSMQALSVMYLRNRRIRFMFSSQGHDDYRHGPRTDEGFFVDKPLDYRPGEVMNMTAIMDPNNGHVDITLNGKLVFEFFQVELTPEQSASYIFDTDKIAFGTNKDRLPMAEQFSGTLTPVDVPRPSLCSLLGV